MHIRLSIIIFIIAILLSCSSTNKYPATNVDVNKDAAQIKKLEYDWLAAEFRLDTASIALMMDETFISVGLQGTSNKQEELKGMYDNISHRLKEGHIIDSFYLDETKIQQYGSTAIVTFFTVTKGHIKAVPFNNRRTRFYDVWIKRSGRWLAVSSQATPV